MKNFKLFIIIAFLASNSFVKTMDFYDESSVNPSIEEENLVSKKQKISSSLSSSVEPMTFTRVMAAAAIAANYREDELKEDQEVDDVSDEYEADSEEFGEDPSLEGAANSLINLKSRPRFVKKKYPCTHLGCDKSFTRSSSLKTHVDSAHLGKRFDCTYSGCDKSFTQVGDLNRHVDSVHLGKKFDCTHPGCDKSFTYAAGLKRHVNSAHLGKRFDCAHPGCDKSFTTTASLKEHVNSAHLGTKFDCTYSGCDKSFTTTGSLKRHVDSAHLGKRFACTHPGCNKSFTHRSNFKRHINSVHLESVGNK